jgi:hypothetical protein
MNNIIKNYGILFGLEDFFWKIDLIHEIYYNGKNKFYCANIFCKYFLQISLQENLYINRHFWQIL